jgi:16S rRNA (guanine(966)-N(2))-methyltransferase RsmD
MRVIAGEFRSRRLKSVPGLATRPTPDRLRESLFSILAPQIEGATFLDAYAGSGAVGIEALSRGAARAIFIEVSRAAVNVIRENLKALGLESRATVVHGKTLPALSRHTADIAFLDPPYESAEYPLHLVSAPLIIAQHSTRLQLPNSLRTVVQGDNALSFFCGPSSDAARS